MEVYAHLNGRNLGCLLLTSWQYSARFFRAKAQRRKGAKAQRKRARIESLSLRLCGKFLLRHLSEAVAEGVNDKFETV
jgi:hypothetical protein